MSDQPESLSVLLIEDNPNDAMLVERYLRKNETPLLPETVRVHHEETLTAGLAALTDETDLLLLDLGLPESEGPETFERVKSQDITVPIIVLTGLTDDEASVELLKQGVQDFLHKREIDEHRLAKAIRYALERQEQKARLQTKNEQLEVLNRILRHDIRNDLQVQQLRAESLQARLTETDISGQFQDDLEKIVESNRHMVELTENSREYLEVIAGAQEQVSRKPIRLDTLLEEELSKARKTHDSARFTVDGTLSPVSVHANEMLSSVFRNLLTNAVVHNQTAVPEVEIAVESEDGQTRVRIADNGPGVPDEKKAEIFGKGELGLDSPGTGIGLYLVYTLASAYGGDVWVEDRAVTEMDENGKSATMTEEGSDSVTTTDEGSDSVTEVDEGSDSVTATDGENEPETGGSVFVVELETAPVEYDWTSGY